eukprot:835692-Rhodomonas_salina.1
MMVPAHFICGGAFAGAIAAGRRRDQSERTRIRICGTHCAEKAVSCIRLRRWESTASDLRCPALT